ncbi:squalene synthase 2-like [Punica granatum]|uniref:Squalene synthase 2-like n=1 Tax=Punica granatum TaxID=22663 RepID=A0A6P8CQH9_PUNGR|nr:squalene synthase 2-like [Punica granatum]
MGDLGEILKHPDEICPMIKLGMQVRETEMRTPELHWAFCYTMLRRVTSKFAVSLLQLGPEHRNAVRMIFYLVLRALDTIEDDMSLSSEVKTPILEDFHEHIYDRDWHFSCGSSDCRVLMDQFHLVRQAFLELDKSHQEMIKDVTERMGAGMAKFIDKEIETIDDLNEYGYYVAGLPLHGMLKMFVVPGLEDSDAEYGRLSNSMGLFIMKANCIRDFLEDIDEIPRPRKFWPREIWSKYVNRLEDLKYEENSVEAVRCLNEMITSSLVHVEDCFKYLSVVKDVPALFRLFALRQVMAIGALALCYNNIDVFRFGVKQRRGLIAKLTERTRTMSDVYGVFFEFCSLMKSKVDRHDPNATETVRRLDDIQNICINSGLLNRRKFYIMRSEEGYNSALIAGLSMLLPIVAYISAHHLIVNWLEIYSELTRLAKT